MTTFAELGLDQALLTRATRAGITEPTPIQAGAIPPALDGRDVMGLAKTGTGKTLAFGLPLVQRLTADPTRPTPKSCRSLILAPTRELVRQIEASIKTFTDGTKIRVTSIVGGVGMSPQERAMSQGVDILVATPGRLMDLIGRRSVNLNGCGFLVLDEADQMLDMGFIHALRKIAALLPRARQTMLFSATMPKQMEEIAGAFLFNPVKVQVNPPGQAAEKIAQEVHFVAKAVKIDLLIEHLDAHRDELALVFGRTKHGMEKLSKILESKGFACAAIHGNKSQGQRERALQDFRDGKLRVLVATDVAARGLDIPEVKHVYNFELPNVPESYVHRIGRTARAGREGKAIAYCSPEEMGELRDIEKVLKAKIPVASGRPWSDIAPPAGPSGGRPQQRRGGKPGGKPGGAQGAGAGAGAGAGKGPRRRSCGRGGKPKAAATA